MQRDVASKEESAVPGVIDTIADGLSIALARPFLLLVPMLLDLYYWLGPKITIEALTTPIRTWTLDADTAGAADVASQLEKIGQSDITWLLSTFVPSLLSELAGADRYELRTRATFQTDSWWLALPILIITIVAAALLLMVYAVPLSNVAVSRSRSIRQTLSAIGLAWFRFLGLLILLLGIALLLLGPLAIASAALLLIGVNVTPLLTLVAALLLMFGYLVLWFAPDAIVVSEVGPVKAIKYSYSMIRGFFWQSIGLAAASLLITIGLGEIWNRLAYSPPGLLLGVIANAFFATGLAIASMSFYAKRIHILVPGSVK